MTESDFAARWIRPEVRREAAYAVDPATAPVRLDRNESPWETPEELRRETLERLQSTPWSRYAAAGSDELVRAIAARENVPPEAVVVANGSNALFLSFFTAVGGAGRIFALTPPTFGLYAPWARATGGTVRDFPLAGDDLAFPEADLVREAARDPGLVLILCTPNNPTGSLLSRGGLEAILATGALAVVDEAYGEFISEASARELLNSTRNLILVKTFSKALALAGARVGYLVADPELAAEIRKVVPPYCVNLFARCAALAALSRPDLVRSRVEAILLERERVRRGVEAAGGARIGPSRANFLYLRPDRPAEELLAALLARGVLVRRVAGTAGTERTALRVTVGTPPENDRFLEAWKGVVA